jgi:hypothetical protein
LSEPQQPAEAPKLDVSSIDPEKDFMCFGTIEVANQECAECAFKAKCAEKAGVKV